MRRLFSTSTVLFIILVSGVMLGCNTVNNPFVIAESEIVYTANKHAIRMIITPADVDYINLRVTLSDGEREYCNLFRHKKEAMVIDYYTYPFEIVPPFVTLEEFTEEERREFRQSIGCEPPHSEVVKNLTIVKSEICSVEFADGSSWGMPNCGNLYARPIRQ